ncbi:uncharacterized protein KD926_004776 [Aspergillus affinis]|uniref:uncharacterized protein n=1 Tax=Aspergillus affinis TaxID=1070780 RepID=UPI0022FDF459|nr:uncharacterized protein KD926_004776 [Aspergillus affinis]KAI9042985.1 hypothetical protein KD926_004776 [Aspergillus affinis]
MMAAVFDTVPQVLTLGLYLLILACLARLLMLLSKRSFPANAPKFVPGYPVVGALRFFFDRERFCHESMTASPTGNYSYYLGQNRVVGLSGPQGRKTFFESRDLDLDQGVNLFAAFGTAVERGSDPSDETHDSYLRTSGARRFCAPRTSMARIRQEVDQVVANYRKGKQSTEQVLQTLDLHAWEQEFPLIDACLLETTRMRGGSFLFRKNISRTDMPIGDTGEVIQAGAYVTYHSDETHMDPSIYPDPLRWDPGRFLSDRAEHRKEFMGYVGFGLGRRTCHEGCVPVKSILEYTDVEMKCVALL